MSFYPFSLRPFFDLQLLINSPQTFFHHVLKSYLQITRLFSSSKLENHHDKYPKIWSEGQKLLLTLTLGFKHCYLSYLEILTHRAKIICYLNNFKALTDTEKIKGAKWLGQDIWTLLSLDLEFDNTLRSITALDILMKGTIGQSSTQIPVVEFRMT